MPERILFPGYVNCGGKCAIVSPINAVVFISILRSHDWQMTEGGRAEPL